MFSAGNHQHSKYYMYLLVPISGDSVETKAGVKHAVLSYAPHTSAPSVYIDDDGKPVPLAFDEIATINGTPVKLQNDVFVATSELHKRTHLPQKYDTVLAGDKQIKVKELRLREKLNKSKGMMVIGNTEEGENLALRLADVSRVFRSSGGEESVEREYLKIYGDYLGA